MIIQMLPDASEEAVDNLEKLIGKMEPITTLIDRVCGAEACGETDEEKVSLLAEEIFKEMPEPFQLEILGIKEIQWQCDCSEERLEKALMTIGAGDLTEIIEEDGEAELVCQFCLKKYHFDKDHLLRILASIR